MLTKYTLFLIQSFFPLFFSTSSLLSLSASFPLQLDSFREFAKSKLSAIAGEKLIRWPRSGEDRVGVDRPSPPPQINWPISERPVGPTAEPSCAWPRQRYVSSDTKNMAVSIERRPAASARPVLFLLLAAFAFLRGVAADGPASEETPHRRFEYKYSFKGPHLAQSDGGIPFWIHTGSKFLTSCQHHHGGWQQHTPRGWQPGPPSGRREK